MASTPRGHETRSHETRSRGTQHIEPACATSPDLFLHPLLEDPPADVAADPTLAARLDDLLRAGRTACAACPLFAECLYAAVVHRDVAGFVACTTAAERAGIRSSLGVDVADEDLDAAAGVRGERRRSTTRRCSRPGPRSPTTRSRRWRTGWTARCPR